MNDKTELEKSIEWLTCRIELPPDGRIKYEKLKDMGGIGPDNHHKADVDCTRVFASEQGIVLESMPAFQDILRNADKFYNALCDTLTEYASKGSCVRSNQEWGELGSKNPAGNYSFRIAEHSGSNFGYHATSVKQIADAFDLPIKPLQNAAKVFLNTTLSELRAAEDGAALWWDDKKHSWGPDPAKRLNAVAHDINDMLYAVNPVNLDSKEKIESLLKIKKELDRIYKL
jgi:hypothetical protein